MADWSPEMGTLDQLLGGDMPLKVIRAIFPSAAGFSRGIVGLLASRDVRLLQDSVEVPEWRWRTLFADGADIADTLILSLTESGAKKIA